MKRAYMSQEESNVHYAKNWTTEFNSWSANMVSLVERKATMAQISAAELIEEEWRGIMLNSEIDFKGSASHVALKRRKKAIREMAESTAEKKVLENYYTVMCCVKRTGVELPVEIRERIFLEAMEFKRELMEFSARVTRRIK